MINNIFFQNLLFSSGRTLSSSFILNATYSIDNSVINNPERGLYHYTSTGSSGGYNLLSTSTLTGYRTTENITVIQRQFFLIDFISGTAISNTYLTNMQTDFDRIRTAGVKVIPRFTYTSDPAVEYQPTKINILSHITQLTSVINTNKDVIVSIQAGFIGKYGEWYYTGSSEFGDGDYNLYTLLQWTNRSEVLTHMFTQFDSSIPLQVRYVYIKDILYSGTAPRLGFYNDAFLNTYGDEGTFNVGSSGGTPSLSEISIFQNSSLDAPISGESNGVNSPRTDGANAVVELDYYNWSLLNKDYHPTVILGWSASGHLDTISKNLGYRLQLNSSTFTKTGNNMNVLINLTNIGYANSFKSRNAYIIFKNNTTLTTYQYQITTDVNTWYSNVVLNQTFNISSLISGSYSSYIWLPDNDSTLSTRSEYSIRFSNTGTWDSVTGYNNLNQPFTK